MINKIVNYISVKDGIIIIFFKDNSSVTVDLETGTRWGYKVDGSRMDELPTWAFENITIE